LLREMTAKKILLSAHSCAPGAGSEPGIGWNWAQAIAAGGHQVTVITRAVNRTKIESLCRGQCPNPQFVFHDLSPVVQKLCKLPLGNWGYYVLWQYTAAKRAAELHRTEKFDQVHHITWGSFRAPSFMGRLGIPFLFGPVGGGEDTPELLRKGMGWRGRFWDLLRRFSNRLLAVDPLMRSTYANASEILATTRETLLQIPPTYRQKARIQPAAGVVPTTAQNHWSKGALGSCRDRRATLEIVNVGRLVPYKGLHLALRALAALGEKLVAVRLTVIGAGYDAPRLKRMARQLNLGDSVKWIPWMPREDLLRTLSDFDLFLFPSLHDSGGMAVLEALSSGLPVVCLDLGGPSEFVDDTCGRVVQTSGADEGRVVAGIATSLVEFLEDPSKLEQLSKCATERAKFFTWQEHVRNVYGEALVMQSD
jgi:glycosyltransferase involved in cell wall biosynthesis